MELQLQSIEEHLSKIIEEINEENDNVTNITINTCPYEIGISSHVLVSVMGILENRMDIDIPKNCYIFHEKSSNKQLSIKEASLKLYNILNN